MIPMTTTSDRHLFNRSIAPAQQLEILNALSPASFQETLARHDWPSLRPTDLEIFQINVGKLCNMTCAHCHVDAGPDRREIMDLDTINACLDALDQTAAHTVDITGGAPELNPHFRYLVDQCAVRGKHIIDRCNLTVLLLPTMADLPAWLSDRHVEIVCSLPHYHELNTDQQRGNGTFAKSILALQKLNQVGYGQGDRDRRLTLISNPVGTCLASSQKCMEIEWKKALQAEHDVTFDRLITLNNLPISRFLESLQQSGNLETYMERLVNAFNPATINGLMCRNTISVSWDGYVYDCDFNQMLELGSDLVGELSNAPHIKDFNLQQFSDRAIVTGKHCFGCTAGAGGSCGGALAD